ncbi:aspartyl protease family protein [Geobacter sp. AOG1]|uniref:aspartyl protease family protein n=1 Tax=Geobacter sp. AOG1 TaxID=1566346 RepID=UPI001CC73A0C|nr:aspartyl protease family protein [Geobacter sp. AOG1]
MKWAGNGDEQNSILISALYEFADAILDALRKAAEAGGEASHDYIKAQTTTLDLLSWLAIPLVRSSTSYRSAITVFDDVTEKCADPQVRKKLVSYTNQLKNRWLQEEPAVLIHNPRARRLRRGGEGQSHSMLITMLVVLAVGVVAVFMLAPGHFGTLLVGNRTGQSMQPPAPASTATGTELQQPPAASNEPPVPNQVLATPSEGANFYKYTDANGVIHFVDNGDNIPPAYRNQVTQYKDSEKGQTTSVRIVGDQVLVPVTLRNGSIAVQVWLVLDTGASLTTIHEDVAARLNIDWNSTRGRSVRIADGSQVATRSAMLESISVGSKTSSPAEVSIMPFQGEKGKAEGLLGMNFLRDHRFHIDFANQQLRWN